MRNLFLNLEFYIRSQDFEQKERIKGTKILSSLAEMKHWKDGDERVRQSVIILYIIIKFTNIKENLILLQYIEILHYSITEKTSLVKNK